MLIAFSLNASIPLMISITQDTLYVDKPDSGLTITLSGLGKLMSLENSMNWMGGILYLPNYDGTHHETVQNLIKTTHLVKEQNNVPEVTFTAPIKKTHQLLNGKSLFFNWYKILRQPKLDVDVSIKNWWSQIVQGGDINEFEEVKQKQNNSIEFADYCRELLQAANLLYYSDIDNKIEIMKIMGSE